MVCPRAGHVAVFRVGAVVGAVIVPDSTEVVDELYERVKERGYVTTGEIFAALPKLEPETQELADIYASFEARNVEVIDEIVEELRAEDANRDRRERDEPAPRTRTGLPSRTSSISIFIRPSGTRACLPPFRYAQIAPI